VRGECRIEHKARSLVLGLGVMDQSFRGDDKGESQLSRN